MSTTMHGDHTVFGVNFADGRIKGYGTTAPNGSVKTFYCYYVRGNADYGTNRFVSHGDGTVTDEATGLMWMQDDSGSFGVGADADGRLDWQQALAWTEGLSFAGHDDWRLPNAKELQSLVDYGRYWTGTTHLDGLEPGVQGAYVCFGRAFGYMNGAWLDVHGAGAQRSDPKSGDPAAFPFGRGPQGDAIRILNLVRPVRDAN